MTGDRGARPDEMIAANRLTAFAVAGAVTTVQEVVTTLLAEIPDADPQLVAEETLTLVSVASARAVEAGSSGLLAETVAQTLINLPLSYHDYLIGGIVMSAPENQDAADTSVYDRLGRKHAFYAVHLPTGQLPTSRVLNDKMQLWMGRISPPGLPEHPAKRLERLSLVDAVATHVRLVFEFARREETALTPAGEQS